MTRLLGGLLTGFLKRPLCLSQREVTFEQRGFHPGQPARRRHLEEVGHAFVTGFNSAMRNDVDGALESLRAVPAVDRGFSYEGLAMGLGLLDLLVPGLGSAGGRWRTAVERLERAHVYMMSIGFGLALARLKRRVDLTPTSKVGMDPIEAALAADGCGFHHGFFTPRTLPAIRSVPKRVAAAARPLFDQGFGRSLWFMQCADGGRIEAFIEELDAERRPDVWSGVGLAAAYAGGLPEAGLAELLERAGPHRAELAQGTAYAALARSDAGNAAPHTELACELFCGGSALEIAELARGEQPDAEREGPASYALWCARLRERFGGRELAR